MLLGEDFRGRHEGGLRPVPRREQEGQRGDDRLAAADVPLEEPGHRFAEPRSAAISRT